MVKEKLENECEADRNAVELMLSGCNVHNERVVKYGITSALCALLFLGSKLGRKTHPDSDSRIIDALEGLDLGPNDTCWLVACVSLNIWQNHFDVDLSWSDEGTFKETFIHCARQSS